MGTKTERADKIEVDDRGRITIPKMVRERLGIVPGDEFELDVEGSRIVLRTEHEGLETATARKEEWGRDDHTLDAGEALFRGSGHDGNR